MVHRGMLRLRVLWWREVLLMHDWGPVACGHILRTRGPLYQRWRSSSGCVRCGCRRRPHRKHPFSAVVLALGVNFRGPALEQFCSAVVSVQMAVWSHVVRELGRERTHVIGIWLATQSAPGCCCLLGVLVEHGGCVVRRVGHWPLDLVPVCKGRVGRAALVDTGARVVGSVILRTYFLILL